MIILNRRGFTLIENLVALAILGIVGLGMTGALIMFKTKSVAIQVNAESMRQINNIIENIRPNLSMQQISFDLEDDAAISRRLEPESLEMAWSQDYVGKVRDCTSCPGRFGYVITEVRGYDGLFEITLRFTHRDWGRNHRDFKILLSGL